LSEEERKSTMASARRLRESVACTRCELPRYCTMEFETYHVAVDARLGECDWEEVTEVYGASIKSGIRFSAILRVQ